jgi:hypothetical protein
MENRTVNILGTEYEIKTQSENDNPKLKECNGLCEQYSKEIVINDFADARNDVMCVEKFEEYEKKVLRHEIFHAFFGESGLRSQSDYAENEELIDWLSIQSPKIFKVFQELEIL